MIPAFIVGTVAGFYVNKYKKEITEYVEKATATFAQAYEAKMQEQAMDELKAAAQALKDKVFTEKAKAAQESQEPAGEEISGKELFGETEVDQRKHALFSMHRRVTIKNMIAINARLGETRRVATVASLNNERAYKAMSDNIHCQPDSTSETWRSIWDNTEVGTFMFTEDMSNFTDVFVHGWVPVASMAEAWIRSYLIPAGPPLNHTAIASVIAMFVARAQVIQYYQADALWRDTHGVKPNTPYTPTIEELAKGDTATSTLEDLTFDIGISLAEVYKPIIEKVLAESRQLGFDLLTACDPLNALTLQAFGLQAP